jgi:hypothetical protein
MVVMETASPLMVERRRPTPHNGGNIMHLPSFFVDSLHPVAMDYCIAISDCWFTFAEITYIIWDSPATLTFWISTNSTTTTTNPYPTK